MLGIHLFECPAKSPVQLEKLPPQPQSRMILKMQSSIPLKWSTRSHVLVTHLRPLSDTSNCQELCFQDSRVDPQWLSTVPGWDGVFFTWKSHCPWCFIHGPCRHGSQVEPSTPFEDPKYEGIWGCLKIWGILYIIYSTVNLLVKNKQLHLFSWFWRRLITLTYVDFRQKILINTEQTVGNSIPYHIKPPSKRANPRHFFPQWVKGCPYKSTICFCLKQKLPRHGGVGTGAPQSVKALLKLHIFNGYQ